MTKMVRTRSMPGTLPADVAKANRAGAIPFVRNEKSFVALQNFVNAIKAAWPVKTASHVAHFTGTTERTVQFWLAGSTRMSLDAVAALLRTSQGFEILTAIMGDSQEEWWLAAKAAQNIRRSRKAIKREQERIAQTRAQLDLLDQ